MRRCYDTSFDRGIELAQRTAKEQLNIVIANISSLTKIRGGHKLIDAARSFHSIVQRDEKLTPNQISFVDNIYEKLFASKGYESCKVHHDKKRKGLRF